MITAPMLEIAVLVLGMVILMVEAFATKIDKRILAFAAIAGLAVVLLGTFFVAPSPSPDQATGFWSFYTADRLSIFFKQFALLTTILVLIMMIDYAPVVSSFSSSTQNGLGEFFAVPIFTCAGLMYLVSAIDFVLRAGQLYPAQPDYSRSRDEISGTQCAFHGVSRVRNCLDFRCDWSDESAPDRRGTRKSGYRSWRSTLWHGARSGGVRVQDSAR